MGVIQDSPIVSIIIPCYNTGEYLFEAIQSVIDSGFKEYEMIIINDGSSEKETLDILNKLDYPKTKIIHQENKGLSAARNVGVQNSIGEILFFLDSDNRVKKGYFEKALAHFSSDSTIGVVYAKPFFFGDSTEIRFKVKPFNFNALLAGNFIDACSFVRRATFFEVDGFDEDRRIKISEDWDFWVRIALTNWKFKMIDEPLFEYRIRKNSLIGEKDQAKIDSTLNYLGAKHGALIHKKYRQYFRIMDQLQSKPFSYFFRIIYHRYVLRKPFIK